MVLRIIIDNRCATFQIFRPSKIQSLYNITTLLQHRTIHQQIVHVPPLGFSLSTKHHRLTDDHCVDIHPYKVVRAHRDHLRHLPNPTSDGYLLVPIPGP